ncbi:unnamed protein product [Ranitomeya imitator]|uniref:RIH domain-containing protein n=1 Tax=Ranitomeya imitator TaxID=111125 RepID=A0ABN9LBW2_9NEOB|nr:unnamed protein product [Ranitomeya imitator]
MIQARKPSSSRIYYRTWKAYFRWCESNRVPPMVFSLPSLLAFLQAGLDSGLALSSLKGQVSALSILFQKTLASRPQIKTFFQGVAHAVPPYRAPVEAWDLNLVLDVLKVSPFEPLREIPLSVLSWKVAFLVAITSIRRVSELAALSCRPPFLVIHQDKVVFRPPPSFLPKVVSTFHLNEDIVLPSFCPAPTHPLERSLNKLDLVRAVRIYLDRTSSFRKTDSFFVIPDGMRRGQPASKATIARWIRTAILEAYRVKNRVPPPGIKAHSTRAVGASWAVHHRASALQLCKAATWSSIHTFAKFYKVHTYASADASLGRRILQAAVGVPKMHQWQRPCLCDLSSCGRSLVFTRLMEKVRLTDTCRCDKINEVSYKTLGTRDTSILAPVQDGIKKPQIDSNKANNYKIVKEILIRLCKLCSQSKKGRNQQQRLLKNMGALLVVLDLLQIPYEKTDDKMNEIMTLAHNFLQNFCRGNPQNQILLHKNLNLFLTPGLLEAETMRHIFMNNYHLCNEISERVVQHFVHSVETHGRHVEYLRFLQTIVKADGKYVKKCQDVVMTELINGGEDVLIFYNDRASFPILLQMMCSERDRADESGPLAYHITLVELLAACTEGKNVYTEIKCNSLLPLDDIVRVVTHDDCIPEVKIAYVNFVNHCYVDTEVEMKEIYTSNHIWKLFENFLVDMARVCNTTTDRKHADTALEKYVTEAVMNIVSGFFSSPFSDNSTSLQTHSTMVQRAAMGWRMTARTGPRFKDVLGSPAGTTEHHREAAGRRGLSGAAVQFYGFGRFSVLVDVLHSPNSCFLMGPMVGSGAEPLCPISAESSQQTLREMLDKKDGFSEQGPCGPGLIWEFPKCINGSGHILIRLCKLCSQSKKGRNQQQRLLKNMGALLVVLDLLQIPYEKGGPYSGKAQDLMGITGVRILESPDLCITRGSVLWKPVISGSQGVCPLTDDKMNEIMTLAHKLPAKLLPWGNPQNQILLHKNLNLFLTPGKAAISFQSWANWGLDSVQIFRAPGGSETMRHIFMNNYHLCNEISDCAWSSTSCTAWRRTADTWSTCDSCRPSSKRTGST